MSHYHAFFIHNNTSQKAIDPCLIYQNHVHLTRALYSCYGCLKGAIGMKKCVFYRMYPPPPTTAHIYSQHKSKVLIPNNQIQDYTHSSLKFDNRNLYQKARIGKLLHFCNEMKKCIQSVSLLLQIRRVFKRYHLHRLKQTFYYCCRSIQTADFGLVYQ